MIIPELQAAFEEKGIQVDMQRHKEEYRKDVVHHPNTRLKQTGGFLKMLKRVWNFFKWPFRRKKTTSIRRGNNEHSNEQKSSQSMKRKGDSIMTTQQQKKNSYDFETAYQKAYDEKHHEFEKLKQEKLIISLVGSVNVGKSKTVNALTGMEYASSKSIAGWTKEVCLYPLKDNIFIADTPGLYDVNADVSKHAQDFVEKDSDVILFFLNATVGITDYEKASLLDIKKLKKPILVVSNKIDALDEEDIEDMVTQIKKETGFEPIPVSARKKTNIDKLSDEITTLLQTQGKDLLFLKISAYKEKQVARWLKGAAASAAAIGAIPLPGPDLILLSTLQIGLAMKIAYIWGCEVTKNDVMKLMGATVTGQAGKQLSNILTSYLKAVGWIPGGQVLGGIGMLIASVTASSITYAFGLACNAYYRSGMTLDLGEVESIFADGYRQYKESAEVKKKLDQKTEEQIPTI